MKRYFLLIVFFIIIKAEVAECQDSNIDIPDQLETLFDRLINNYDDVVRIRINDSIRVILSDYSKSDTVFDHRFTNLRYLGQIVSPDSLIKILTWNLVLENQKGKYFCYFIRKQEPGKKNLIYDLSASYDATPVRTDTTYSRSDWYGALYYEIKPFLTEKTQSWVLLGIDYGNPEISRKIIDALSFSTDGSLVLGKKWFVSDNKKSYRVVFEYASNAMMSLRFRSDSSIVFDHLAPFSASHKDDRQFYGPDYSFDAYDFENGIWKLIINVDVRNRE
jgi:hypothetical protein